MSRLVFKIIPIAWSSLVVQSIFITILLPFASPNAVPYATSWFNMGFGQPLPQQTPQQYLSSYADSQPDCASQGIPCSGHSALSCKSYCTSQGYPYGACDGSCCMCSLSPRNPSTVDGKVYETEASHISSSNWRLETQESSRVQSQDYLHSNSLHSLKKHTVSHKIKYVFPTPNNKPHSTGGAICRTDLCQKAANRMISNMNKNANPCENFYEFACGGFVQKTKIPSDSSEVTPFNLLRNHVAIQLKTVLNEPVQPNEAHVFRLAKNLYKSCMNTVLIEKLGFEPIKKIFDILGGWPVLEGTRWQPHYFTWSNYVAWFRELGYNHDYFMKISVEPDIQNVNRKVFTIGEPTLSLTREVLIRGRNEPTIQAYYKYMVETAVLLGATRERAQAEMSQALNFEIELALSFHRPSSNSRNTNFYNPVTIASLQHQYPQIPWLDLMQRLLPSSVKITTGEIVMLSTPHYVQAFVSLIARTDIRVVSNYAVWRLVSSSIAYLPESARKLQFDFAGSITGQTSRPVRWRECVDVTSQSLGNAVGAMYVRRYFSTESKIQATEMISDIQKSFLQILDEADWMDAATKSKAKEKASSIRVHVGYPEEHLSDAKLSSLYSEYSFKDNDYFGNARHLVKASLDMAFRNLKTPSNKNDWVTHGKTAVVNAFYLPLENAIQFPAAILQTPFFDISRPNYLNYGSIGWIAGHELTHGFDDQGHQFDKNGNFANWWDPFTKNTYTTKTQCIIEQYGEYSPAGSGIKLNGVNSQGENVADNGGIKQAYRGYQSWVRRHGVENSLPGLEQYSPNQLFWVSAAHNWCSVYRTESLRHQILGGAHAPGEFRVKGTFSNNNDFSRDFNCPVGSQMNPQRKCSVW